MHQWIRRYRDLTQLMAVVAACISAVGCAPTAATQQAVTDYQSVASQISIGDAKEYVLSALQTSQQAIPAQFKRPSEQYLSYGEQVEIHFVRTALVSGIENVDDDFTPMSLKMMSSFPWVGPTSVRQNFWIRQRKRSVLAG